LQLPAGSRSASSPSRCRSDRRLLGGRVPLPHASAREDRDDCARLPSLWRDLRRRGSAACLATRSPPRLLAKPERRFPITTQTHFRTDLHSMSVHIPSRDVGFQHGTRQPLPPGWIHHPDVHSHRRQDRDGPASAHAQVWGATQTPSMPSGREGAGRMRPSCLSSISSVVDPLSHLSVP
jgi:hypothetical protein